MSAKRLVLATVITATVLLPQEFVAATTLNGNHLYADCTAANSKVATDQWLMAGTCMGYLIAVMDALSLGNSINGFKACIPSNADMNQIVDVVKNFIRDHPEKRHLMATALVAEAFSGAFPCRQRQLN